MQALLPAIPRMGDQYEYRKGWQSGKRAHRSIKTIKQVRRDAFDEGKLVEAGRAHATIRRAQELGRREGSQRGIKRPRFDWESTC